MSTLDLIAFMEQSRSASASSNVEAAAAHRFGSFLSLIIEGTP
jgi:hypothetical protein